MRFMLVFKYFSIISVFCFFGFTDALEHVANPVLTRVGQGALLHYSLPCSETVKCELGPEEILVISCLRNDCQEGDTFKGRVKLSPDVSLRLDPVVFNDQGWYSCYCGDKFIFKVHLDVAAPKEMKALVGGGVSLSYFSLIDKSIAENEVDIECQKDGKRVVTYQRRKSTYAPEFEGRTSLSVGAFKDGSFNLTISELRKGDAGLYLCTLGSSEHVTPEHFDLIVTEPPSSSCETTVGILASVVILLLIVSSFLIVVSWTKILEMAGRILPCKKGSDPVGSISSINHSHSNSSSCDGSSDALNLKTNEIHQ